MENWHYLQIELDNLRKVFVKINDYLSKTVKSIIRNELEKEFSGMQGIQLLSKMERQLKKSIPSNVKTYITHEGTKLSRNFL